MFCPKCGNILSDSDKFCTSCGAPVESAQQGTRVNSACGHPHRTTELPAVTPGEAVRLYFSRYMDFSGRSRRSEYWGAQLVIWIISAVLGLLLREGSLLLSLWSLATLVPNLSSMVRRLHDTGRSWTWLLWNLLPIAGQIIVLVADCTDSVPEANQWGESPKYH